MAGLGEHDDRKCAVADGRPLVNNPALEAVQSNIDRRQLGGDARVERDHLVRPPAGEDDLRGGHGADAVLAADVQEHEIEIVDPVMAQQDRQKGLAFVVITLVGRSPWL